MRVVHENAQRRPLGEVGADPVEAVEDRERRVLIRERGATAVGGARQPEQARGHPGGAGQQPLGAPAPQDRIEELPDDAEGELALQLGAPGAEHPHARGVGGLPAGRQQGRLAHARRPLDDDQGAMPLARPGERPVDPREVVVALQEGRSG